MALSVPDRATLDDVDQEQDDRDDQQDVKHATHCVSRNDAQEPQNQEEEYQKQHVAPSAAPGMQRACQLSSSPQARAAESAFSMCAAWWRQCQAYIITASSSGTRPHSGCINALLKSRSGSARRNAIQRRCSASSKSSDIWIAPDFASGRSAHKLSSYVLTAGVSSVTASFIRTYELR